MPLGLVLRGLSKGYVPPLPFILVSLGVTGVLLTGWRAGLAAATNQVGGGGRGPLATPWEEPGPREEPGGWCHCTISCHLARSG